MVPYLATEMARERTEDLHRQAEEVRRARLALRSIGRVNPVRQALSRGLIRLGAALAPPARRRAA